MTTHLQDMTQEQLIAMLGTAQAKIEALRKAGQGKLSLKVGEKGGICIYGMGRRPIHMYAEQWQRIRAATEQIDAFVEANRSTLSWKHEQD